VLVAGCGYHFEGTVNTLPRDIRRIAIPTVENATIETRLTSALTNELVNQFTISKAVRVTTEDQADAVLRVRVLSVRVEGAVLSVSGTSSKSRRIIVVADGSLARKADGQIIWRKQGLVSTRTFDILGGQSGQDANLLASLTWVAKDLAEKIHNSTFENF